MNTRTTRSAIGAVLALLASVLLLSPHAHAGGRRRVLAVSPPSSSPQLVFVGAAVVDAGTLVWRGESARVIVSTRTVTLRLGERSRESRGTAVLRAFLETPDPRFTIRVDDVVMTTVPRVIRTYAPIGTPFTHRIEIEVPLTAVDGPLQASIGWEATTD